MTDTTLTLTSEETESLKDCVNTEFENADNDDDQQFWSAIHVKLGGDELYDPDADPEDEQEDEDQKEEE